MKQPKTIADLTINLEFTKTEFFPRYSEFENYIKERNLGIEKWNVVPGIYSFEAYIPTNETFKDYFGRDQVKWDTITFDINSVAGMNKTLINFLYRINSQIYSKIKKATWEYSTWTELDRFVSISENKFEIQFTLPY